MGNTLYSHVNQTCELARIFQNKNHIKIKRTRHRIMENGCIWEGMSLMNAC